MNMSRCNIMLQFCLLPIREADSMGKTWTISHWVVSAVSCECLLCTGQGLPWIWWVSAGEQLTLKSWQGWLKSRKIHNCLAWNSRNFKTVWQGESGELGTVCWFCKYCLLDFPNFFCIANCFVWLKVKKIKRYILSTFYSNIKLCIDTTPAR